MGHFPSGKKGRSVALALGVVSGGILHYSEVTAAKQRTRVSKLRNLKGMCHRLSTAQRAVERNSVFEIQSFFFPDFFSSAIVSACPRASGGC